MPEEIKPPRLFAAFGERSAQVKCEEVHRDSRRETATRRACIAAARAGYGEIVSSRWETTGNLVKSALPYGSPACCRAIPKMKGNADAL